MVLCRYHRRPHPSAEPTTRLPKSKDAGHMSQAPNDGKILTQFTISYDAEGDLAHHVIDAKALGNAIIGMDDLVTAAAKILSNGSSEADLKVVAPAKEGSLEVLFAIFADPLTTNAILSGVGIMGGSLVAGTATVVSVIEKIKDRKIDKITVDINTKIATIEVDGEKIEMPEKIAKLVTDQKVRNSLYKVIKAPVANLEGATVKFLGTDKKIELSISSEDIQHYEPIKVGSLEESTVELETAVITFTTLNFKGKKGWRVRKSDGAEHGVNIDDEDFMAKVRANQEAFQKDKQYTVELEHTLTASPSGNKNSYVIKRVVS